jgi:acetyl esterase/lipase
MHLRALVVSSVVTLAGAAALFGETQTPAPSGNTGPRGQGRGFSNPPAEVLLWERGAPGALGEAPEDRPGITVYRAARAGTGTAVIVAPGGSYGGLAMDYEGRQAAVYFNAMGVTAFVLKYRLGPRYHHPIQLGDAQRAIRLVRHRAEEFGVRSDRIGMMGFSAGGHLTATAGTRFDGGKPEAEDPIDRAGSRPDFLILAYPVITFDPAFTHAVSVRNLLGERPDQKLIELLSNERHVTSQTPPTFLFHTTADAGVPAENSVRFYLALKAAGVPVEMHVFENGPHGVGLALADPALGEWPALLTNWMRGRGLLSK